MSNADLTAVAVSMVIVAMLVSFVLGFAAGTLNEKLRQRRAHALGADTE